MPSLARADLESLLRARHLDRTLTTTLPAPDPRDDEAVAPTGVAALDARLGGGLPRGQLSEIVGPRTSGRLSLLLQALAAATTRGELVALVDPLDMLDVTSAAAAGIDLDRLLWVRGHVAAYPGACRDTNSRALEQALRAFTLVLQAGGFGLVAFDLGEAPLDAIRRLPFTTWLRLQRIVEGRPEVAVLVGPAPMARSAAGLTLQFNGIRGSGFGVRADRGLAGAGAGEGGFGHGVRFTARLFEGLDVQGMIARARRAPEDTTVRLRTAMSYARG